MVQSHGVVAGAGWVDLHLRLPLRLLLSLVLLTMLLSLLLPLPQRRHPLPVSITALLLPIAEFIGAPLVQKLVVQPRELQMERLSQTHDPRHAQAFEQRDAGAHAQSQATTHRRSAAIAGNRREHPPVGHPAIAGSQCSTAAIALVYDFWSAAVDRYQLGDDLGRGATGDVGPGNRCPQHYRQLPHLAEPTPGVHPRVGFTVSPVNSTGPRRTTGYRVKDLGRNGVMRG